MSIDDRQEGYISGWMTLLDQRMDSVEKELGELKTSNTNLQAGTADVVAAFESAKAAFKVLEWFGKIAKPLLWVGGVATAGNIAVSKLAGVTPWKQIIEWFSK